jgi:hypothetical protein
VKALRWIVALFTLLFGRRRAKKLAQQQSERIVPAGTPERRAEVVVVVLLGIAALFAIAFPIVYAEWGTLALPNELLGICLGGAALFIAFALMVVAKWLVVTEEVEEEYPPEHVEDQETIAQLVHESGSRITRKRMLLAAAGVAGGALGVAALTPAVSLGPLWYTAPLFRSPWRRGTRLVDESDNLVYADDINEATFYTAFPEGADKEDVASPIVVGVLEDLHARRVRDRAVPQANLPGGRAPRGAGVPLPLFDVRSRARGRGHLRPGRAAASSAAADDRQQGGAARGGRLLGAGGTVVVERAQREGQQWLRGTGSATRSASSTSARRQLRCCARRFATCSPTTGRSCSARWRCTRSWS